MSLTCTRLPDAPNAVQHLAAFMAQAALAGKPAPDRAAVARLAAVMGLGDLDYEAVSGLSSRLADAASGSPIRAYAASGDPSDISYAIEELASRAARMLPDERQRRVTACRAERLAASEPAAPAPARPARPLLWAHAAVAAMLLWALNPANPYGYYILLRFVCSVFFGYLALKAVGRKEEGWTWACAVAALFYNPFVPLHLDRQIWSAVNVATLALLAVSAYAYVERTAPHG